MMSHNSQELVKIATMLLIQAQEWDSNMALPGKNVINAVEVAKKRLEDTIVSMKRDA